MRAVHAEVAEGITPASSMTVRVRDHQGFRRDVTAVRKCVCVSDAVAVAGGVQIAHAMTVAMAHVCVAAMTKTVMTAAIVSVHSKTSRLLGGISETRFRRTGIVWAIPGKRYRGTISVVVTRSAEADFEQPT
ncbi:MAG: hypothetical protein J0H83_15875 [Candidatus Melainabacteria bacterium]|nr:hypothetical protein [Candidatus Melainabacteria bacterium]MBX9674697.1 hypothetical protein [Candidatus Obscuribacterales bacterium]